MTSAYRAVKPERPVHGELPDERADAGHAVSRSDTTIRTVAFSLRTHERDFRAGRPLAFTLFAARLALDLRSLGLSVKSPTTREDYMTNIGKSGWRSEHNSTAWLCTRLQVYHIRDVGALDGGAS